MVDISMFFIISVFTAGILSFFSPCIIPLLPVYVSALSGGYDEKPLVTKEKWASILRSLVFVVGLATAFVIMGFGAGALGTILYSRTFIFICGLVVVFLGIHQTGLIHVPFLEQQKKMKLEEKSKSGILGMYLLGFAFSFGWTPCVGPILATVLGLSSSSGQAAIGATMMLIYTVGLAIPFVIVSIFTDFLMQRIRKLNRYILKIKLVGGILIIIMGLVLMADSLNIISRIFV